MRLICSAQHRQNISSNLICRNFFFFNDTATTETYTSLHTLSLHDALPIQLDTEPYTHLTVVDAGDAPVVPTRPERALRVIHQKVRQVASHGAIPIVLGGDHSITYPSAAAVSGHAWPSSVGVLHFDAHADTGADQWGNLYGHGQPMRRLIEEGWVAGRNFVQVGLRGYWPDRETFDWMRDQGFRWHTMV